MGHGDYYSEEESSEEESEFDDEYELVKNIPMTSISMTLQQGHSTLSDIWSGKLSMTDGLPELFYNTDRKQLLVEDGNHRIFQRWLDGEDTFDAYVKEGDYHGWLSPVYEGQEVFDWDEDLRED